MHDMPVWTMPVVMGLFCATSTGWILFIVEYYWCKEIKRRHDELNYKYGERTKEVQILIHAIVKHKKQKADDRCWMDDLELYKVLEKYGYDKPPDNRVGDQLAMLGNCVQFVKNRCEGGGPWKSYTELEKENAELKDKLNNIKTETSL